jgi:malonyl CoA-acyl carrier protein transacylase
VNGNSIPKDAIHRIIIRNHVREAAGDVIMVANPNVNSGQQNVVAGMNWAVSKLGPISYRVDAEARGVPTTLAGGLTEPTASAIMMDVNKALQLG